MAIEIIAAKKSDSEIKEADNKWRVHMATIFYHLDHDKRIREVYGINPHEEDIFYKEIDSTKCLLKLVK